MLKNPAVLESLVTEDPRKPLDRGALEEMAEQELASAEDFEDAMEALRSFKNTATLRIALLDLLSELPIEDVLRLNSEVAEICLVQTSRLCIQEMQRRYPLPTKTGDVLFFVVATGTLGSQEMGYGSDIDMLFLFDEPEDVQDQEAFTTFITRLGQRILRALTTTGRGGYRLPGGHATSATRQAWSPGELDCTVCGVQPERGRGVRKDVHVQGKARVRQARSDPRAYRTAF